MNNAKFLRTAFFIEHLRQLLLKVMFETCQNFTMKNKKLLLSFSGIFIDNLDHVHNWVGCFTNDNHQVKAVGKDYENVKPV